MQVRDHTKSVKEYKGRWTWAVDSACPCRTCYIAHDCGYVNSQGKRIVDMQCATNYNKGCPSPKPKPKHILSPSGKICKRCKAEVR